MRVHLCLELVLISAAELGEQPLERERAKDLSPFLFVRHKLLVGCTLATCGEHGGQPQLANKILEGLGAKEHREELHRVDERGGVKRGLAGGVVLCSQLVVREHLVSFPHRLEAGVSVGVVDVLVRMQLLGELEVGLAYRRRARVTLDAQRIVQLRLLHRASPSFAAPACTAVGIDAMLLAPLLLGHRENFACLFVQVVGDPRTRILIPDLPAATLRDGLGRVQDTTRDLHCPKHNTIHGQGDGANKASAKACDETLGAVFLGADDGCCDEADSRHSHPLGNALEP
mmetsp:Transcript_6515/g.13473  ORF Transcript_6515/g.13473 Transcript_6515/m.13473 type:complete len:286 (-) Transcript_6515:205-1062(-)